VSDPTPHHETEADTAWILERRLSRFERQTELLASTPSNLGIGSTRALRALGAAVHQRADKPTTLRCLRFARDCALAILRIAQPKPGTEPITIDGQELTLDRLGPWSQGHCGHWKTAFFGSLLLRDEQASAWLAEYPIGILRASETTSQEYGYTMVEALQGFRLDRHGWNADADLASEQAQSDPENDAWNREIGIPILRLFQGIYSDDEGVNALLLDALKLHIRHYTRGSNRNDPRGFFSLPLAALAAWAHDCEREITVEADYLPRWLIAGRFR
jgi:hypothetical protein